MNTLLLAVDDGLTNSNYNWADIFFLASMILAVLSGLAYVTGHPVAEGRPANQWGRYSHWAAALLAFAVGCFAFGLFLL